MNQGRIQMSSRSNIFCKPRQGTELHQSMQHINIIMSRSIPQKGFEWGTASVVFWLALKLHWVHKVVDKVKPRSQPRVIIMNQGLSTSAVRHMDRIWHFFFVSLEVAHSHSSWFLLLFYFLLFFSFPLIIWTQLLVTITKSTSDGPTIPQTDDSPGTHNAHQMLGTPHLTKLQASSTGAVAQVDHPSAEGY